MVTMIVITITNMMNDLPNHLGGHMNVNHIDLGALQYLHTTFKVKSLLDVGCGLGEMKNLCDQLNISYMGIDGDWTVWRDHNNIILHDYTKGKSTWTYDHTYDLAWSTEFVEHVEEKYIDNFMNDIVKCKYALITHALPRKKGYHHVNCQTQDYWINIFSKYNFKFDEKTTKIIRAKSSMEREFIRENGLFFKKEE